MQIPVNTSIIYHRILNRWVLPLSNTKSNIFAAGTIVFGGALTALRLNQHYSLFEPATGLIGSGTASVILYGATALLTTLPLSYAFFMGRQGNSIPKKPVFHNVSKLINLALMILFMLICAQSLIQLGNFEMFIYKLTSVICSFLFLAFCVGFFSYCKLGEHAKGVGITVICSALSMVIFIVSRYVHISEMNVLPSYIYTILSLIGLTLFFSYLSKVISFGEGQNKLIASGFFSVCMLMAQCITYIVLQTKDHAFYSPFALSSYLGLVFILFILSVCYDILRDN